MKYYIYQLRRWKAIEPFYIGATYSPSKRLMAHRAYFNDRRIQLEILETHTDVKVAAKREVEVMLEYMRRGVSLANSSTRVNYSGPDRLLHALRDEILARQNAKELAEKQALTKLLLAPETESIIAAFLATQKALLTANDEEAAKISAAYFTPQKGST